MWKLVDQMIADHKYDFISQIFGIITEGLNLNDVTLHSLLTETDLLPDPFKSGKIIKNMFRIFM